MAEISKIKLPSGNTYDLKDSVARSTTEALNTAIAGKQDTIDSQHKLDYSLIANTPTIPPADYVAMIDITSSVDGSGNVNMSATIVSGTFAEIDAALLAQKTVLVIGRYPRNPVSYQYFRCGEHRPAAEIVFTSTGGGEWFRGMVTAATWYPAANGEPERVLVDDASGILSLSPMGDGNAVTSIEKNTLFPIAVVKKDKTFVDTAEQSLTEEQKAQARTNIGATAPEDIRQFKVLNLGDFSPSGTGEQTLGTKSEAAAALNITEAQVDSLLNGEYDYIEFGAAFYRFGGYKISLASPYESVYMCLGIGSHFVTMPYLLEFWNKNNAGVYSYNYAPIGIKDVTVGGESVINSGGVAVIPAIPDVSQFITNSVNDLANYYLKSETYTKDEVASLIGAIQQFHYEIAASTSAVTDPSNSVLYLIGPTGSGADKYEEYVYDTTKPVAERWIKIGDTSIDLSGYVTTQALNTALAAYTTTNDLATLLSGKQDTIDAQHKLDYSLIANTPTIPTVPTDMVKYTAQTLTDAQKAQARTNIGAGTYSKPSSGIPAADLASGVIPDVSQFITKSVDNLDNYYKKTETYNKTEVDTGLSGKQPTIDASHKLDYSLLENTPTIPAAPVNADWNATEGLAKILNKPTIPAAQVPADWNATEGVSRILNKPTVPTQYAGSPTAGGFANKAVAIPFGSVDSTSTATEITATVDNFPETLTDGVCAFIRNNAVASASGFTLNINGTGAKPVYQTLADASRVTTVFNANSTYLFVYNSTRVEGGCWDLYYGYNTNDNTIGYNLRTNGASAPPAAQKYYRYRLLFTAANNQSLVPANTSSSTNATAAKTVNQTKIDPFGVIFYYSYTSAVNAAASPNASYLWMQYNGIALGYSFNRTGKALEMTARDPVYLKCAPQSDGSAIIDANNPIVQALPTTADGKIYIFLGFAESATALTLYYWHPVYYHDGTKICIWTGVTTNSGSTETDEYLSKNLTFAVLSPGTIEWRTAAFTPSSAKKINYRINNGAWVESVTPSSLSSVTNTDAIIFVSQGDIVEISGVGTNPTGGAFPSFFVGTARFKAYGNIMSLIGGDDFVGLKTITVFRAFANLFTNCVGLVDASNLRLPATTLSSNCYEQMFAGCTSLTMPPMMLPATTLNISCYSSMFKNCTALTNVPVILATTLGVRCCDSMFYSCTSITASPSLRVISLANYCFENMFYGCTSLNYVIALFTDTPGSNYTNNWLNGVSATGTFVKNSSATWDVSGSSGIPSGWTVETTSR